MKRNRINFKLLSMLMYFAIATPFFVDMFHKNSVVNNFKKIQLEAESSDFITLSENISNLKYYCDTIHHFVLKHPLKTELGYNFKSITSSADSTSIVELRNEFNLTTRKILRGYTTQRDKSRIRFYIIFFAVSTLYHIFRINSYKKSK